MSRGLKPLIALMFMKRKAGRRIVLLIALTVAWAVVSGYYACALPGRPAQLHCAVTRNTGFAHMTRGMNTDTIAALKAETRPDDVPYLKGMLLGNDSIAAMTAAEVMKGMGRDAQAALVEAYNEAKAANDISRAMLIAEYAGLSF